MLGNAGGARSTREGKGKPALLVFPYFYTARPKLHKRLLRRLAMFGPSSCVAGARRGKGPVRFPCAQARA